MFLPAPKDFSFITNDAWTGRDVLLQLPTHTATMIMWPSVHQMCINDHILERILNGSMLSCQSYLRSFLQSHDNRIESNGHYKYKIRKKEIGERIILNSLVDAPGTFYFGKVGITQLLNTRLNGLYFNCNKLQYKFLSAKYPSIA